jgi:hypothetical protein
MKLAGLTGSAGSSGTGQRFLQEASPHGSPPSASFLGEHTCAWSRLSTASCERPLCSPVGVRCGDVEEQAQILEEQHWAAGDRAFFFQIVVSCAVVHESTE